VVALAIVYPLGVLIDHLADRILTSQHLQIRSRVTAGSTITILELLLKAKDGRLTNYFDYLRIRIRISRSTMLNFTIIAIVLPIYLYLRLSHLFQPMLVYGGLASLGCLIVARLAYITWHQLTEQNYLRLVEANAALDRLPPYYPVPLNPIPTTVTLPEYNPDNVPPEGS